MKYIILVAVFLSVLVSGQEIKWEKSYSSALAKAKTLKKPVMFIISNHNCRFCRLFESTTLKDPKVVQRLNDDFVNAVVYIDEDPVFPHQLDVPGTPGTWFLKPDGEPMFQPVMGAVEPEVFLGALKTVKDEFKQLPQR